MFWNVIALRPVIIVFCAGARLRGTTVRSHRAGRAGLCGRASYPYPHSRTSNARRDQHLSERQAGAAGIVIESVMHGSPAARAGVRQGDKIVAVNWSPVTSVADLRDAAASQRAILAHEPIAAVCFWS